MEQPYGYVSNNPLNFVDPSGMFAELICEPIPTTRGGWKNAVFMLLSRAHHCFIHVKCRDYDVTLGLYGPLATRPEERGGALTRIPSIPTVVVFVARSQARGCPLGYGDSKNCRLEDNLLNAFRKIFVGTYRSTTLTRDRTAIRLFGRSLMKLAETLSFQIKPMAATTWGRNEAATFHFFGWTVDLCRYRWCC